MPKQPQANWTGLIQYTQDYDETMPMIYTSVYSASNTTTNYKWMDAIYPYVRSNQIFSGPSDSAGKPF